MNKIVRLIVVGALFLSGAGLWAFGGHLVWSAERIVLAALALAVMGLVVYL